MSMPKKEKKVEASVNGTGANGLNRGNITDCLKEGFVGDLPIQVATIPAGTKFVHFNKVWELPNGSYCVMVGEEVAQLFLSRTRKNDSDESTNRPRSKSSIQRIRDDILADKWWPCTHGILFDEEGFLVDGQHRLHAIVAAAAVRPGLVVPVWVGPNTPQLAIAKVDTARKRSVRDYDRMYGLNKGMPDKGYAIARSMIEGWAASAHKKLSEDEESAFITKHFEAIVFAHDLMFTGGTTARISVVPVAAVIARAFYTADHECLRRFCRVLRAGTGYPDTEDETAVHFRDVLKSGPPVAGQSRRQIAYRKTESALASFLAGKIVKRIHECKEELFHLPEEAQG